MVIYIVKPVCRNGALIAQLGERQTEDLKVPCSIHGQSTFSFAQKGSLKSLCADYILTSVLLTVVDEAFCKE